MNVRIVINVRKLTIVGNLINGLKLLSPMSKEEKLVKIDVKESTRDRLQLYKQKNRKKYRNVDQIIKEWLNKVDRKK